MSDNSTTKSVEYRPISGFPGYRVGNDGSVWSCKVGRMGLLGDTWKRLKQAVSKRGVCHVVLCQMVPSLRHEKRGTKCKNRRVHVIVLEAFVGPKPLGPTKFECCHNDGNPSNNTLCNLRWDTPSRNTADKVKHGTLIQGSKQWLAAAAGLNEDKVAEMRRRFAAGGISNKQLAEDYNVSESTASRIIKGQSWKHVG